jgi:hypothetical protein
VPPPFLLIILSLESWCVLLWYISSKMCWESILPSTYAILPRQSFRVQKISETVSMEREYIISPRFLCRPTALYIFARAVGRQESYAYGKQRISFSNSGSAHFHVSWLSDFIFYQKPLYKSLHQSFFYSFITILPSESGVTLHYCTILP